MLIENWMTREVITVDEDTSVMEASKMVREKGVRLLPVVNPKGRLVGMVSDRDIKEASPSKATTLDVHELYYLLSKLKIKEIMSKKVWTVGPRDTVEKAAAIMLEKKISGLPVVDEAGKMVGLLTQGDVFKVLLSITGIYRGGVLLAFELDDRSGSIKEVADAIRSQGGRINSVLTSYETAPEGKRNVFIRALDLPEKRLPGIVEELQKSFNLLHWVKDELKGLKN